MTKKEISRRDGSCIRFDENAACHIALGQCYSKCFKNGVELTNEEFTIAKRNLLSHLDWIAKLSAEPSTVEEPESCSSIDGKQCFSCEAIDSIFGNNKSS